MAVGREGGRSGCGLEENPPSSPPYVVGKKFSTQFGRFVEKKGETFIWV